MEKLRKALSGQDQDNDSSTGILPVSKYNNIIMLCYSFNSHNIIYIFNNIFINYNLFLIETIVLSTFWLEARNVDKDIHLKTSYEHHYI